MSLSIRSKGGFTNILGFLKKKRKDPRPILEYYGQAGVDALSAATPVNTGLTAASWYYEIERTDSGWTIQWSNSNVQNGVPIALIIQMGHATKSGGYVNGVDYINPALADIFKRFSIEIGKELEE